MCLCYSLLFRAAITSLDQMQYPTPGNKTYKAGPQCTSYSCDTLHDVTSCRAALWLALFGWRHLSDATCLAQPRFLYVLLFVSRIAQQFVEHTCRANVYSRISV